ncbi:MAG: STAS domain-containing protein, partial [Clostridia bacterium]|nr:STAS domain-containing protein [Clostridia bacterium]
MNSYTDNEKLHLVLEGRIDSNNAAAFEKEVESALSAHPGIEPMFDAEKLEYISSAGLRVLMKVRK